MRRKAQNIVLQRQRGNASAETLVAMLALSPFLIGIPLLGKQLDVKQKTYDAARYSAWERTVWRSTGSSNYKSSLDIEYEIHDRMLGDAHVGVIATTQVRQSGVTANRLWVDIAGKPLFDRSGSTPPVGVDQATSADPVKVGWVTVPQIAYADTATSKALHVLDWKELGMNPNTLATAQISLRLRPLLPLAAQSPMTLGKRASATSQPEAIVQSARSAILSDTWSARDENQFRSLTDGLTVNEAVWKLELPGIVPIGALGESGKGTPLYGEGQYGWGRGAQPDQGPNLQPNSANIPTAYIGRDNR